MKKFFKIVVLLVSFFVFCAITHAQPQIHSGEGDFNDGGVVILKGDGFGSHNKDYYFLGGRDGLIERTAVGSRPSLEKWIFGTQWAIPQIVNEEKHSGNKSIKVKPNNSSWNGDIRFDYGKPIGYNKDIFVSWWVKRNHSGQGQWKMFRMCYTNSISDPDVPQFAMFNWDNNDTFNILPGPDVGHHETKWGMPYPVDDGKWYRLDLRIKTASAHGRPDAFYEVTLFDPENNQAPKSKSFQAVGFNSANDYYRWFLWQNYSGNGINFSDIWMDDLYIQVGTHARVELVDSPNWSLSRRREIQPIVSWSSGQIGIKFNPGSFHAGERAYLFVVDSQNRVSDGYQVVVGGSNGGGSHQSCDFHGQIIPHGESVTAYQHATVPFGQSCQSQVRVCSDGELSGDYVYQNCTVEENGVIERSEPILITENTVLQNDYAFDYSAFVIKGNNITLDFNGHQVKFGTKNNTNGESGANLAVSGIVPFGYTENNSVNGLLNNGVENIVIKNGSLKEGVPHQGTYGIASGKNWQIKNMIVEVKGGESTGVLLGGNSLLMDSQIITVDSGGGGNQKGVRAFDKRINVKNTIIKHPALTPIDFVGCWF